MRALLVEEGWHSTLYLASALERAGFAVTVLTANDATARSRRRTVDWVCGPAIASDAFLPDLERRMAAGAFDVVLPLTEAAMLRLWAAPGPWSARMHPVATPRQRALVADKHALIEHMAGRGIAVPDHRRLDTALDLDAVALPAVVKGATGSGGRMVRIVETRGELAATATRARALGGDWIVQDCIASPTFLVGGLFHDGRPLRIYAAEKLEQYPARTGGAIHLRSCAAPELVDAGLRVMRELGWTGFASADFVMRDGRPLLLEVNPRLWGSLAGALSAGVDLFAPFVELLRGAAPGPDLAFAAGDECWIFPRYLNATRHRSLAGARRALRHLRGPQGADWRDPAFVVHIVRRLRAMRRLAQQL